MVYKGVCAEDILAYFEYSRLSATVPLLLLHRVSATVCPMLSVTVLCLRTLLRNMT